MNRRGEREPGKIHSRALTRNTGKSEIVGTSWDHMDAIYGDENESINGISVGLLLGYTELTNLKGRTWIPLQRHQSTLAGGTRVSYLGYVYNLYITITRFTRCSLDSRALLCPHVGKAPWVQCSEAFRPLRLDAAISLN